MTGVPAQRLTPSQNATAVAPKATAKPRKRCRAVRLVGHQPVKFPVTETIGVRVAVELADALRIDAHELAALDLHGHPARRRLAEDLALGEDALRCRPSDRSRADRATTDG